MFVGSLANPVAAILENSATLSSASFDGIALAPAWEQLRDRARQRSEINLRRLAAVILDPTPRRGYHRFVI